MKGYIFPRLLSIFSAKKKQYFLIWCVGQQRCIGPANLLLADDDTDLSSLNIRVISGKEHGELFVGQSSDIFFTGMDIATCSVVYAHDDSDTFVDNIIFEVSDGDSSIEFLFPIWIVPIDDQPPQIIRNMGAEIYSNGNATLDLEDIDIDSDGPAVFTLHSTLTKGRPWI